MRLEDFAYASLVDYYQLKDLRGANGGSELSFFTALGLGISYSIIFLPHSCMWF